MAKVKLNNETRNLRSQSSTMTDPWSLLYIFSMKWWIMVTCCLEHGLHIIFGYWAYSDNSLSKEILLVSQYYFIFCRVWQQISHIPLLARNSVRLHSLLSNWIQGWSHAQQLSGTPKYKSEMLMTSETNMLASWPDIRTLSEHLLFTPMFVMVCQSIPSEQCCQRLLHKPCLVQTFWTKTNNQAKTAA